MAIEPDGMNDSSNDTVSRAAFRVTFGGLISYVVGFGFQLALASIFGAGAEMDAFLTAMVVPLYLQAVLIFGLSSVFIPAFVKYQANGREDEGWALAGTIFWLTGVILTIIAISGSLFARQIIDIVAPGLTFAKAAEAASMLAIMMFAVPLSGLAALTEAIQQARNRFFWPAVAPALASVGNLVGLFALYWIIGAQALAWGFLVAITLQAAVTITPVMRHGWQRLVPVNDERVVQMGKLMAPIIFFGLVTRCVPIIERYFASRLPDGNLSYLGYSTKVAETLRDLVGAGIAAAIFPAMSRAFMRNGEAGLVEQTEYGLRLTLAIVMPMLAISSALAVPLVAVLFERGAFQHVTTLYVSSVLPMIIIGTAAFSMLGKIPSRAFYVTRDTRTVSIVAAVATVLYFPAAKVLTDLWGYLGLGAAQALYYGLINLVVLFLIIRRLTTFRTSLLCRAALKYAVASLVAFAGAQVACGALSPLPFIFQLTGASCLAVSLYMIILYRIDGDTARSVLSIMGVGPIVEVARTGFSALLRVQ